MFPQVKDVIISPEKWKEYVLVKFNISDPLEYNKRKINNFREVVEYSMKKEGYVDENGNIAFYKSQLANFILNYSNFFHKSFINLLIEEAAKEKESFYTLSIRNIAINETRNFKF